MVACAAFWVMKFARPAFVALSKEVAKFRRGSVVVGQCVLLGEGPSLSGKVRVTATLAREGLSLKGVTTETVVRSGESTPPMDLPEMESLAALLAAGVSRGALEVTATRRFPWNAGAPRSAAAERVLGAAYREGAPVSREEPAENVSATVRVLQRGARTTLATVLGDPAAEALCAPLEGADDEEDANEDFAFAFPSVPLGRLIARVHSDASVRASVRRAVGGIEAVSPVALAAVRRALRFAGEA